MLFFYCDPPYVGARQGHYAGYNQEDFSLLLKVLAKLQGKFLLSSYKNEELFQMTSDLGWKSKKIEQRLGVSGGIGRKEEILTWNYSV